MKQTPQAGAPTLFSIPDGSASANPSLPGSQSPCFSSASLPVSQVLGNPSVLADLV